MTLRPLLALAAALAAAASLRAQPSAPPPAPETVIECTGPAETTSTDTETVATFRDNVVVTGTNLKLSCDFLRVVASRKGDPKATIGKYGYFKTLVAVGHVKIIQGDREATCGHAEIFPGEDRVVLSRETKAEPYPSIRIRGDKPANDFVGTGPRMILYRGERKAVVEPEDGVGSRFTLPSIKDLGFDKNKPKPAGDPAAPTGPAAPPKQP
jgi:lipopolysaccharide export system protein LptA